MLHFSLDSPVKEEHDASRGVACFDFVMESIKVARRLGERPDILFTVFETNIHQIEEVWRSVCLPNDLVLILNPVFGYNSVETGNQLSEDSLKRLSGWAGQRNVYINEGFLSLRRDGGNHISQPVCRAGSATVVISPENKLVLPCYHLGIEEIPIQGALAELYHSEKVQKLIALEGRLPACEGCTINCYMQPSFAVETSKYFWKALPGTIKYNKMKGTWKQLL
jgi:MoaA/NifB/PqqE/SkfB family radical SAM enzyme